MVSDTIKTQIWWLTPLIYLVGTGFFTFGRYMEGNKAIKEQKILEECLHRRLPAYSATFRDYNKDGINEIIVRNLDGDEVVLYQTEEDNYLKSETINLLEKQTLMQEIDKKLEEINQKYWKSLENLSDTERNLP